ncbi:MAG: nucleotide exchange factor GrpE [Chitinophagaceae bacterium]|nr:nucleotide exchange factor GrpE [Chitinophagaceae bacterium]
MQEEQELNDAPETEASNPDINSEESVSEENTDSKIAALQQEIAELKDKYLRQVADFDNLRKRAAKERLETIQTAGKDVITSLLTVLDDSERAAKQIESAQDINALKEGLNLVFGKLRSVLQSKGLKPMDSVGKDFNPEFHEAITEIPAPTEELKGKVIDEVEKGYYLNDKIIRFAKVVVGK